MKRVLVFSHAMELGGVERALLGLLEAFDPREYSVDLFLMRHAGEMLKDIPKSIHLLPEIPEYASLAIPIVDVIRKGCLNIAFGRFRGKLQAKKRIRQLGVTGDNDIFLEYSHLYTKKHMPQVGEGVYDLAISFLTPHYFVAEKVRAKKKVAWIHTDYSVLSVDRGKQLPMWEPYDSIISISEDVTKSFVSLFPELASKVQMISHILPVQYMHKQATAPCPELQNQDEKDTFRIVSVGRFCYQKNFDNVPAICKCLHRMGVPVKWFLIGYGSDESLIRQRIKDTDMEDNVCILGKKENPYPYIKACDLYVQPSRYEGKCVSVMEAQILGKPVVITDYPTSGSQLENGVDGVIVPMDNEGCAAGIAALLRNPEKMEMLRRNCAARDYSNGEEIVKLYEVIEIG